MHQLGRPAANLSNAINLTMDAAEMWSVSVKCGNTANSTPRTTALSSSLTQGILLE